MCIVPSLYVVVLVVVQKKQKIGCSLGPHAWERFYVLFLRLYVLYVQKGGDLGYSFLTLVELNSSTGQTKKEAGNKQRGRAAVWAESGNMAKEQQASIYTGGTLLHLPSSPSWVRIPILRADSHNFFNLDLFFSVFQCVAVKVIWFEITQFEIIFHNKIFPTLLTFELVLN